MSFRKEAIIKAGGFDERFGGSAHLEETDLCLRIRKAGYKTVFDPKAELIHLKDTKGGCRAKNYEQWFYWYGHNNMLFLILLKKLKKPCNFLHFCFNTFLKEKLIRQYCCGNRKLNKIERRL